MTFVSNDHRMVELKAGSSWDSCKKAMKKLVGADRLTAYGAVLVDGNHIGQYTGNEVREFTE